jgi:hypothetical protein
MKIKVEKKIAPQKLIVQKTKKRCIGGCWFTLATPSPTSPRLPKYVELARSGFTEVTRTDDRRAFAADRLSGDGNAGIGLTGSRKANIFLYF